MMLGGFHLRIFVVDASNGEIANLGDFFNEL